MKKTLRMLIPLLALFCLLAACGKEEGKNGEPQTFTLRNQAGEEVTVPAGKPALFFFFTTYT
ncbi:hypothetical protein BSNK01_31720 [Bacillaceae bacterium]